MTDKKEDGWFGLKEKLFDFMLYMERSRKRVTDR